MGNSLCLDATSFAAFFMAGAATLIVLDGAIAGFVLLVAGKRRKRKEERDEDIRD